MVSHNHTATPGGGGGHHHRISRAYSRPEEGAYIGGGIAFRGSSGTQNQLASVTNARSIGSHSHSGGTVNVAGGDGQNNNLPPYYALAYIMKGVS